MKVYAILNRKGGTGKTTTAHNMGAYLIREGFRVLFIDLDSQCNLTTAICGTIPPGLSSIDLFRGEDIKNCIYQYEDINIIPGSPELAAADLQLSDKAGELKKQLQGINRKFDFVVIDTPPNMGMLTTAALIGATDAVICAGVDLFSIQGMTAVSQQAGLIRQRLNKRLHISGVLLTRYDKRGSFTRSVHEQIKDLCGQMNIKLFKTVIRENIALKEAAAGALDIFSYAPRSNGAKDYTAFMGELMD